MALIPEWEAEQRVGEKVLEMVERLKDIDALVPGTQANWMLDVDAKRYKVTVTVVGDADGNSD